MNVKEQLRKTSVDFHVPNSHRNEQASSICEEFISVDFVYLFKI